MCLTISITEAQRKKLSGKGSYKYLCDKVMLRAKKNITVYKLLTKKLSGPFITFQYEYGSHYYQRGRKFSFELHESPLIGSYRCSINEGLHSYSNKGMAEFNQSLMRNPKSIILVKCIVPRGSLYMKNYSGSCVSDNLIIGDGPIK